MTDHTLNAYVRTHLGGTAAPQLIQRTFPGYLAADVAIASKDWLDTQGAELVHFSGDPMTLFEATSGSTPLLTSAVLEQIDVPDQRPRCGLREGLALLRFEDTPMLACCRWEAPPSEGYWVSVLGHDLDRAQRLLDAWSEFVVTRRTITSDLFARIAASLNTRVRDHFGPEPAPTVLTHTFPEYQIANVSVLLKEFLDTLNAEFTGCGKAHGIGHLRLSRTDPLSVFKAATIDRFGHFEGFDQTAPVFAQITIDPAPARLGLAAGIALLRFEDTPVLAWCEHEERAHDEYRLTIIAEDLSRARRLLNRFLEYERAHSIFRGRLIRPSIDYGDRVTQAEILPFGEVGWADVVLPDTLRRRLERDVLEYIRTAPAIAANGIGAKRNVLFHGPPGTGKSFVCRLLATELRGFTSVLITGDNLRRPEAAFALARSLAPALLFFEDVDLVARDRDTNASTMALSGLLNELDGIRADEHVYVVFTTNRLDVLEDAFAQRPGRVDMIVRFPLPDAPLRGRLVRLHAAAATVTDAEVDWIVERTDGVTPAFLREFMKEAVFTAVRGGSIDASGIATIRREHAIATFERFAEIRQEQSADRILGFRS